MNAAYCAHVGVCGGCPWGAAGSVMEQRQRKLERVAGVSPGARMLDLPSLRLRDRVDLTWSRDGAGTLRLGLYALESREIIDITECPMMSPNLEAFFRAYRERKPPIDRGSVRLRVAPDGSRGAWLDFANLDVKILFEERDYLAWLNQLAFVEIGQRRKTLVFRDGVPRLIEPTLKSWFETYDATEAAIPLFGPVGGFSQSGFTANRTLVGVVTDAAERSGVTDWLELFGGSGNFALALAARGLTIEMFEQDELAVAGLKRSLEMRPDLSVDVRRADLYSASSSLPALRGRGVLVDPPRAGLRQTLDWLARERPPAIIYVSCFADTFARDAALLKEFNYRVESLVGIDQFAHSPHAEWVALFKV